MLAVGSTQVFGSLTCISEGINNWKWFYVKCVWLTHRKALARARRAPTLQYWWSLSVESDILTRAAPPTLHATTDTVYTHQVINLLCHDTTTYICITKYGST